jgi:acyl CoA:acetate/3-ketoacid CoA transferase beta subunit
MAELMCVCLAKEIENEDIVILGSFTPLAYAAYILAKLTHAPDMLYVAYSSVDAKPFRLSFLTSEAAAMQGGAAHWGMSECINSFHLRGVADVEAISSVQIDGNGDINLSVIGDYQQPRVRLPGGAGAPEVIKMHKKMVGYFPDHTKQVFVNKVDFITGSRYLVSRGERMEAGLRPGPIRLITNLAVLFKEEKEKPFTIESLHPGVMVEEVLAQTGFELTMPDDVAKTEEPTRDQVKLIREVIDPFGTIAFDFKSGKERLAYLEEVLEKESRVLS